jgi:hypothetical protein
MIENILSMYDLATESDRSMGKAWYNYARWQCQVLADRHNVDLKRIVYAVAALSPMMQWERNIAAARLVLEGSWKVPGAFSANVEKAWHIIYDETDWERWLSGAKVRSFAANILGDENTVTVDTWAWRIWSGAGLRDKPPSLAKVYDDISDDYRRAAERLGLAASDLQAITWVTIRRLANGRASRSQLSLEI